MLTYSFENIQEPLYEHLYKCIKNDIVSGKLPEGFHLPSKRSFAGNLNVSVITIENAYSQLIDEGYVYTKEKRGYFVSDIANLSKNRVAENLNLNIKIPDPPKKFIVDFSSNFTKTENFPFSVWKKLLRKVISQNTNELLTPSPCNGLFELRKAISSYLISFRGMKTDPNQIVIGAGTEYLYGLLIQLLGQNKKYCVENPGYKKIAKIYESNKVDFSYASIDDNGICMNELRNSNADIVHISPTHHFPTGITMPIKRRLELLSWADEKECRFIIEDDYDSEFRLSGKPVPTLFSIDNFGKVIYMNTFSKSLSSTIRISYMILPVKLANLFYEKLNFYSCTVSNFEQLTLAKFIKDGYFEKHINRMRLFYSRQRKSILELIRKSSLAKKSNIIERDSGLHFILQFKTNFSDEELCRRFEVQNIHISPLSDFYSRHNSHEKSCHNFILNYSNLNTECIPEALEKISRELD